VGEAWAPNARVFGLGYHHGWLYHGGVDTREDKTLPGSLSAHIYRSRADGGEVAKIASVGLEYPRTPPWQPWDDAAALDPETVSQPLVTDIELRPNGDPVIALGDRTRDMVHWVFANGDLLPTRRGALDDWSVVTEPEHYEDGISFDESLLGGVAAFPGLDTIVATADFVGGGAGGLSWFGNRSGRRDGPSDGREWVYGDGFELGDVESLCRPLSPVYLPIVGHGWCSGKKRADVVLVLDMSTSMRRTTRDGRPKHVAAIEAAGTFVDLLDLAGGDHLADQVAVVGFNDAAWVEQGLTSSEELLHAALLRISGAIVEGTRLDLALDQTEKVLTEPEQRAPALQAVVMLTDGLPNRVPPAEDGRPETTILRAADKLKTTTAHVYTIGLGKPDDIDEPLLRAIASDPSMYRYAPDAEDLEQIFSEIAQTIGCP